MSGRLCRAGAASCAQRDGASAAPALRAARTRFINYCPDTLVREHKYSDECHEQERKANINNVRSRVTLQCQNVLIGNLFEI